MTVFRDELPNLLYGDEDAKRLHQQSFHPERILEARRSRITSLPNLRAQSARPRPLSSKVATAFRDGSRTVEASRNRMRCAGFRLLRNGRIVRLRGGPLQGRPRLWRALSCFRRCEALLTDDLIVTDGFSCREMIRQETDRQAFHFAQVLQMAIREGCSPPIGSLPEVHDTRPRTPSRVFP